MPAAEGCVVISVSALRAGYGGDDVLRDVSLEVHAGECVGLLGPSGCGKSTLLRVVTGQLGPRTGTVDVDGWRPDGVSPPPLGLLGIVQQDPIASLDPLWSIRRCVAEPLVARRRADRPPRSERERQVAEQLADVRLGHIEPNRRVTRLSVGQAQRVAMARALIGRPRVIVADEPTSALDPTTAATVVRLMRRAADAGAAVLVVSHHRLLLESFCERTIDLPVTTRQPGPTVGS